MEEIVREILKPFEDRYDIISCGSCENYIKDGLCAELRAKFPIRLTSPSVSWGTAYILIENPYVHIIKGFGNDIQMALNSIR